MSNPYHKLSDAELAHLAKQTRFKILRTKNFLSQSVNGSRVTENLSKLVAELERNLAAMQSVQTERAKYMR